jgi:hypothetical protein
MNLYFVSGLGADKRIFQKLVLPPSFHIHHIEWVPVSNVETMEAYCMRLAGQIDQTKPYSLIGVSFGGVVSIQLSKHLTPVQTVIISSFCYRQEVSKLYTFLGRIRLHQIFPTSFFLKPNGILYYLFGVRTREEKDLLKSILADTDPGFFRWAIDQLFLWNNSWRPETLIHIHGTADKILPYHENMKAIPVEGGEHLMVFSKAAIVSGILEEHLLKH